MYEEKSDRVRGNSYHFKNMHYICWCLVDADGMHEMENWGRAMWNDGLLPAEGEE
jgi:hypothetical protein